MQMCGDISLYFHIPFCKKKCLYCNFYSIYPQKKWIDRLFYSLSKEVEKSPLQHKNIVSIFFGGGTPSLIEASKIAALIQQIPNKKKDCEITLEVNPEDVSLKKISNLQQAGINRISVGVQSFQDLLLQFLGRRHSAKKAINAIETIFLAGIQNISIDLLYDIPGQQITDLENSLKIATSLPIQHLSFYGLTLEKNTPFYQKKKKLQSLLSPQKSLDLLNKGVTLLQKKGFYRYEIASYARKKTYISTHNIGYWIGREFLGFGPSAFSYYKKKRFKNISNIYQYTHRLKKNLSPIDFEETLSYPQNIQELLAIHFRITSGVDLQKFQKIHGTLPKNVFLTLEQLMHQGLLERQKNNLRLSQKGLLFYDDVATHII